MKVVYTKKGEEILVSDEDYDWLNQWSWYLNAKGHVVRYGIKSDGDRWKKAIYMHREIIGAKNNEQVDHKNRCRNDNRRGNLRKCTSQQNSFNRMPNVKNATSQYKGISKVRNGWLASITVNGKPIYLGCYTKEEIAACVYNHYAKHYFGEFALLNAVPDMSLEECLKYKPIIQRKTSKYKGVNIHNQTGRWLARLSIKGKVIHIGLFNSEVEAAIAYNKKATEVLGDKAKLNIIDGDDIND